MGYHLYPLEDESRLQEICDLFAKGLGETTVEYWKWKHFTPNGLPQSMLIAAEDDNGKLVGMYALQPTWYQRNEERILIVQTEDLVIDDVCRGTGLMKELQQYMTDYYSSLGADGWVAYANPVSYIIFQKYGAKDQGDIFSHRSRMSLFRPLVSRNSWCSSDWVISMQNSAPEDLFFTSGTTSFRMEKTAAFMKWKFDQNPNQKFQWLLLRKNNRLVGYVVFHVNHGRLRSAVNIHDWDLLPEVTDRVLRRAVRILRTMGNWVSLWGRYDPDTLTRWRNAGVEKANTKGTHFLLCPYGDKKLPDQWHLTRADLDF